MSTYVRQRHMRTYSVGKSTSVTSADLKAPEQLHLRDEGRSMRHNLLKRVTLPAVRGKTL